MPALKLNFLTHMRQFMFLCVFIFLAFVVGRLPVQAVSEISYHKVIAPKNILIPDGLQVILWQDYGSFGLYHVQKDYWNRLPQEIKSLSTLANEMDLLLLDNGPLDSNHDILNEPDSLDLYDGKALQLIQFVGPIKGEWLETVKATGAELVHYIANNGYMVWTGEQGRLELQVLAKKEDFLQYSAPYLPSYKLGPTLGLQKDASLDDDQLVTVTIQLFRHSADAKSKAIITDLFIEKLSPWEPVLNYQNVTGVIARKDVPLITHLPDVVWVGEKFPRELTDEVQGRIIAGSLNPSGTKPGGPGYLDWYSTLGLSTNPNDYPIVDITDDGIGNGNAADAAGDVTFRELGTADKLSRIAYIANCTSAETGAGPDGHGHINLSIAGGYDDRNGYPYKDAEGYQRGLGINPYGRFAGTRVFDKEFNLTGCGGTDQNLIRETYNRGARIASNSWGCSRCAGVYDTSSQAYDAGVRDADPLTPGNQEFFILFSAGNSGPDPNTIGTPGNGKNMITVGATESVRPSWIDGCGIGPDEADNAQDMADFSSRGPAPGERIKPDVVVPGTHIQGTASTTPFYNGDGVCDKYHPTNQKIFTASSGTSHSTPAVAGMASLVHTYIRLQEGHGAPSPALIKGFIIANTSYLTGAGAGDNLPNQSQGFGLPDMTAAFDDTSRVLIDQDQGELFTESGQTWSQTLSVADPTKPVRIVMAYTDQPGATGTQPQVNDLNLTVQANGKTYLGNVMTGQWSTTGGTADKVNNVEAVFLPLVRDTALKIVITAFNIAGDGVPGVGDETDQDFTLVCINCIIQEDFSMIIEPQSNSICLPGTASYNVVLESIYNFTDPVTLDVVGTPMNVMSLFDTNPVTPPGQSMLTLTAGKDVSPGSSTLTITGKSAARQHSSLINLDVFSQTPLPPEILTPSNGAISQPLDVKLTWAAGDEAATYNVEIATDSAFEEIIGGATNLTDTSYTPPNLQSGRLYYWRVRAENKCGTSIYSAEYIFSTETLPGSCPVGVVPDVIYSTDFEGDGQGWSSDGSNNTWTLSTNKSHSSDTSYYAQNLGRISDQNLISPEITLPPFEGSLTMQFWNYQEMENDELADKCFDGGILEISIDNGLTWKQIGGPPGDTNVLITDQYDGFIDIAHQNPLGGLAAWCGDPQDWLNSVVRLDNYAEKTVRFRFRLGTDESVGRDGWYIDDLLVQSCTIDFSEVYFPVSFSP